MEYLVDYCVNKLLFVRFVMNPADCCVKIFGPCHDCCVKIFGPCHVAYWGNSKGAIVVDDGYCEGTECLLVYLGIINGVRILQIPHQLTVPYRTVPYR